MLNNNSSLVAVAPGLPARWKNGNPAYERRMIADGVRGTEETIELMRPLVSKGKRDINVRKIAGDIITGKIDGIPKCEPKDYYCYAKAIYTYCRDKIQYAYDPYLVEYLESPDLILKTGIADCDSIVMLFMALCENVGLATQWVTIKADPLRPDEYSHIYARVFVPSVGWIAADPTMPWKQFGWEPPKKYPRRYWNGSTDADGMPIDTSESANMSGLGCGCAMPAMAGLGCSETCSCKKGKKRMNGGIPGAYPLALNGLGDCSIKWSCSADGTCGNRYSCDGPSPNAPGGGTSPSGIAPVFGGNSGGSGLSPIQGVCYKKPSKKWPEGQRVNCKYVNTKYLKNGVVIPDHFVCPKNCSTVPYGTMSGLGGMGDLNPSQEATVWSILNGQTRQTIANMKSEIDSMKSDLDATEARIAAMPPSFAKTQAQAAAAAGEQALARQFATYQKLRSDYNDFVTQIKPYTFGLYNPGLAVLPAAILGVILASVALTVLVNSIGSAIGAWNGQSNATKGYIQQASDFVHEVGGTAEKGADSLVKVAVVGGLAALGYVLLRHYKVIGKKG